MEQASFSKIKIGLKIRKNTFIPSIQQQSIQNRIKLIADELDLEFTYSGGKPSKKKLKKILDKIPYSSNEVAIIGIEFLQIFL